MPKLNSGLLTHIRRKIAPALFTPPALPFLPALTLATFWIGGEAALLWVALGLPILFAALGGFDRSRTRGTPRGSITARMLRDGSERGVRAGLEDTHDDGLTPVTDTSESEHYTHEAPRTWQSHDA